MESEGGAPGALPGGACSTGACWSTAPGSPPMNITIRAITTAPIPPPAMAPPPNPPRSVTLPLLLPPVKRILASAVARPVSNSGLRAPLPQGERQRDLPLLLLGQGQVGR